MFGPNRKYARSKALTLIALTQIVGSKPTQGIDICQRLSTSCCPVWVENLRRADRSLKECYQMQKWAHNLPSISELDQAERPSP